ncbi:Cleavage stimulating factor 64 [Linum perenne]
MASSSQHRCVFVGNIPYDVTEEQLIEICREVGPVVSFRLVTDRETGKPKGYGFCEYKDEETALSARRNLQGYEINGRQLRVDFAENDKNADRNREQGRQASNADARRHGAPPAFVADSAQHQPLGVHIAMTAATVMTGALGAIQTAGQPNQNATQGQSALPSDPLTFHLAKMSRSQLNEIMFELKVMATRNREAARQLLLSRPQLPKALFQLQMPNIRALPSQPAIHLLQNTQQLQQALPVFTGPAPSQGTYPGLMSQIPGGHSSVVPHNALVQEPVSTSSLHPMQPQNKAQAVTHVPLEAPFPRNSAVPPLPPAHPIVRSLNQVSDSSFLHQNNQQSNIQQHPGHAGSGNFSQKSRMGLRPLVSDTLVEDPREPSNRPTKLQKLDDGRRPSSSIRACNVANNTGPGSSQIVSVSSGPVMLVPKLEENQAPELQPDMESALLQQVLNLTPEQLMSLPPEQQQQVIQLQKSLRQDQYRMDFSGLLKCSHPGPCRFPVESMTNIVRTRSGSSSSISNILSCTSPFTRAQVLKSR